MESMYGPMAMVRTGPAYTMSDGPGWMLMIGVSVPIWTELSAGVREAEAMHAMALADQQAMRRMIEGEAASARESVVASRERFVTLRDEVLPRAERAIGAFVAGYSAGTLPLVSLLEALDALWSVQGELVLAEITLGIAWLRLDRATAGGAR
jgi:outer membrane protein TolC